MKSAGIAAATALIATLASAGPAQAISCEGQAGFDRLDFWVGEWEVFVGDRRVGSNRIEKILQGCAIMEHWTDIEGGQGKSLFFYTPATDTWKQVWVTETAGTPGGVKEKTLVERMPDGGVRFRGTIALADGRSYLDRTTLTPLDDGSVRQHIEISRDGETWETTFDARYVRPH
jgi:hypothetical protein